MASIPRELQHEEPILDNITHTLTGLALASAGLGRATPYATAALVIGSNLPDCDWCSGLAGKSGYLIHHRGVTHSLLGIAIESLLLPPFFILWWKLCGEGKRPRYLPLAALSAVATILHVLMDGLNTYGIRPFLPFLDTWYYGDIAFIVDPWIWLILAFALARTGSRRGLGTGLFALFLLAGSALLFLREEVPRPMAWLWSLAMTGILASRWIGWPATAAPVRARRGLGLACLWVLVLLYFSISTLGRGLEAVMALEEPLAIERVSVRPGRGIPWHTRFIAQTHAEILLLEYRGLGRDCRVVRYPRGLEDPALAAHEEAREVQAWRIFARHPVVDRTDDLLILDDARYRDGPRPGWSRLELPLERR